MTVKEFEKNGILYSLQNFWKVAESNPQQFRERNGQRFLYAYPESLSGQDRHRTFNEILDYLQELESEGTISFYRTGRLFMYSLDKKERSFDIDEFFRASLAFAQR